MEEAAEAVPCNVHVCVKKTFISVACTSAREQPHIGRRRTYPLGAEEELQPAQEESRSPEEGSEHDPYPRTPMFDDAADFMNFHEIEPDFLQSVTYLAHASANSTSSPESERDVSPQISKIDVPSTQLSTMPPLWQSVYQRAIPEANCTGFHDCTGKDPDCRRPHAPISLLDALVPSDELSSLSVRRVVPIWQSIYLRAAPGSLEANGTAAEKDADCSKPSHELQEQHRLKCVCSEGKFRVIWHVEKRKLSTTEKQIISPSFRISFGAGLPEASCKLVLHSQGPSFQRSRGHGQVHIKCETVLPEDSSHVSASFIVGTGLKEQPARGPVRHSFAQSATCGLSKKQDVWDLRACVNKMTKTVAIRVEITPLVS